MTTAISIISIITWTEVICGGPNWPIISRRSRMYMLNTAALMRTEILRNKKFSRIGWWVNILRKWNFGARTAWSMLPLPWKIRTKASPCKAVFLAGIIKYGSNNAGKRRNFIGDHLVDVGGFFLGSLFFE